MDEGPAVDIEVGPWPVVDDTPVVPVEATPIGFMGLRVGRDAVANAPVIPELPEGFSICADTVNKIRKELGFKHLPPIEQEPLSESQKQLR
jgi:hypothetical protein